MTQPSPTLHDLQQNLASAGDAQIARIVAMVDAIPNRGVADALIAPLRPRLAQLRPARPLSFTRLVFTPIDSLVVPASQWLRGSLAVPRSALAPIAADLRKARPDAAALADVQTAMLTSKDQDALAAAGATLWSQAAVAFGALTPSADWAKTGLSAADHTSIVAAIEAVLHVATEIDMLATGHQPVTDEAIRTVLGRTVPRGPQALSTVTAVLLARLPDPERIVALAAEATGVSPPRAADRAVEYTLDRLQEVVERASRHGVSILDAARITTVLAGLEASASTRPDRKRRIEQIRRDTEAFCHRLVQTAAA